MGPPIPGALLTEDNARGPTCQRWARRRTTTGLRSRDVPCRTARVARILLRTAREPAERRPLDLLPPLRPRDRIDVHPDRCAQWDQLRRQFGRPIRIGSPVHAHPLPPDAAMDGGVGEPGDGAVRGAPSGLLAPHGRIRRGGGQPWRPARRVLGARHGWFEQRRRITGPRDGALPRGARRRSHRRADRGRRWSADTRLRVHVPDVRLPDPCGLLRLLLPSAPRGAAAR